MCLRMERLDAWQATVSGRVVRGGAWLAQLVQCAALGLRVVSSSPLGVQPTEEAAAWLGLGSEQSGAEQGGELADVRSLWGGTGGDLAQGLESQTLRFLRMSVSVLQDDVWVQSLSLQRRVGGRNTRLAWVSTPPPGSYPHLGLPSAARCPQRPGAGSRA